MITESVQIEFARAVSKTTFKIHTAHIILFCETPVKKIGFFGLAQALENRIRK